MPEAPQPLPRGSPSAGHIRCRSPSALSKSISRRPQQAQSTQQFTTWHSQASTHASLVARWPGHFPLREAVSPREPAQPQGRKPFKSHVRGLSSPISKGSVEDISQNECGIKCTDRSLSVISLPEMQRQLGTGENSSIFQPVLEVPDLWPERFGAFGGVERVTGHEPMTLSYQTCVRTPRRHLGVP